MQRIGQAEPLLLVVRLGPIVDIGPSVDQLADETTAARLSGRVEVRPGPGGLRSGQQLSEHAGYVGWLANGRRSWSG